MEPIISGAYLVSRARIAMGASRRNIVNVREDYELNQACELTSRIDARRCEKESCLYIPRMT